MSRIGNIKAREIKDSRGNPTVEVELTVGKRVFVASCPSGASTGKNEAVALPVSKAIENVNEIIAPKLKNQDPANQKELDELMIRLDGTQNKSKLGANAILSVSMVICRAGASSQKLPLYHYIEKLCDVGPRTPRTPRTRIPLAMFNFIEGGVHANNDLDIQEFMVIPQKSSFKENLILANKVFENLKKNIVENYGQDIKIGDEGGFTPEISKTEQALFLLKNSIGNYDTKIAIDAAASQFYKNGKYTIEGRESTRPGLVDFYKNLVSRFSIFLIEDPFSEEDWEGFKEIKKELPDKIIVGDDLTTTNVKRIKEAHSKNACNGVIIKPNQIGTITETIEAAKLAKSYGWKTIVSHRSGETMDTFIADLAVGIGADLIKSGSPSQPERMLKYNRLLEIENDLRKQKTRKIEI